ncbi:glycosyltransferase family 2 protein [Mucilaginibacter rigui]|uniref:Glycosyltransferase family 2 protein n=1 Tax=Mucilaginibacter rigui TaxID=534635 RepID=A0ABR7X8A3_9SPHI|nr:glycosyltransferase family 2 protein [Mucilaginibacter rigui]MBD1386774.1 glycosyltransferase family 2 protein [Mucilaginibacter rigui]
MDKDLVSVIMPAYNAEAFIKDSIGSVIDQTYSNWELIVIDDGSADGTAEIIKQLQLLEARITYLHQPNGKQGKARNLGIQKSKGDYIAFLDADDKWTPDKLSVQMNVLIQDNRLDLIFSQGYKLTDTHITDCDLQVKGLWDIDHLTDFLQYNQIPILSVIVKKHALLQVNNFTEKAEIQNAEDYHLWLKLLLNGYKFKSIASRLFYYRIHESQSTYQNSNIDTPIFFVYKDIYHLAQNAAQKKVIVSKLKWYIFKKEFHAECIELFVFHLKNKGLNIISSAIKKFFAGPKHLQEKIVFNLISLFA